MDANFQLTEEILSFASLKNTTTDKDLFHAVKNCIGRTGLKWNKMTSVTTAGARALTRKNVGLLKLMNDKIKAEHPSHALIPLHCIIHHESLCKGALLSMLLIQLSMLSVLSEPRGLITGSSRHCWKI